MSDDKPRTRQRRRVWLLDAMGVLGLVIIVAALWDAWRPLGLAALGGWLVSVQFVAQRTIKKKTDPSPPPKK